MSSDQRLKKNIEPLAAGLDKVMRLRPVTYRLKDAPANGGLGSQKEIGLIAQEVEKVLPELVHTGSNGYKAVSYDKLVSMLIEAVKEQQKEIREQDAALEKLEKEFSEIEEWLTALAVP